MVEKEKAQHPGSGSERPLEVARKSLRDALRLSFNILKGIMAFVVGGFLCSNIFTVQQHEVGLVFRFGRIVGTGAERVLKPGLHWAWPFPIDEHVTVPAARVHTMEVGFVPSDLEKTTEGARKVPEKLRPRVDAYCLTGDANIIHSKCIVRYRIADAVAYVTGAEDPEEVLRVLSRNAAIRETSGFGVDEALRTDVDELRRRVQRTIEAGLRDSKVGIAIEGVDLSEIFPPAQVRDAFNSVIMAENEKSRNENEARAYRNKILSEVKGEAARIVSAAKTYQTRVVERAEADSEYLRDLLRQYPGEPERLGVYLDQLYEETVGKVIAGVEERFVVPEGDANGDREIRYIVGPEEQRRK